MAVFVLLFRIRILTLSFINEDRKRLIRVGFQGWSTAWQFEEDIDLGPLTAELIKNLQYETY